MNKGFYTVAAIAVAAMIPFMSYAAGQMTVVSEPFSDAQENHIPADILMEGGEKYLLISYDVEDVSETGRKTEDTDTVEYENIAYDGIPETIQMDVTDPITGELFECEGRLLDYTITGEYWSDGFLFDITVHDYDADYFMLGEKKVLLSEEDPLKGYEGELLEMIGVDHENYRIETISWKDAPYLSENGILCRDLTAKGEMRSIDCRATYRASFDLPDLKAYRTVAVYQTDKPEETAGMDEETIPETEEMRETQLLTENEYEPVTGLFAGLRNSWFTGQMRERLSHSRVGQIIVGAVDWIMKTETGTAVSLGALALLFVGSAVLFATAVKSKINKNR